MVSYTGCMELQYFGTVWGYGYAFKGGKKTTPNNTKHRPPTLPFQICGTALMFLDDYLHKATYNWLSLHLGWRLCYLCHQRLALSARRTNRSCALAQIDFCLSLFFPLSVVLILSFIFFSSLSLASLTAENTGQSNRNSQSATHQHRSPFYSDQGIP